MANEAEQRELINGLNALARRSIGGGEPTRSTWENLFASYDRDGDGRISFGELVSLLEDADVGSWFTRDGWARNIIFQVDYERGDKDGTVSLIEFMTTLRRLSDDKAHPWTMGLKRLEQLMHGGDSVVNTPPPLPDAPQPPKTSGVAWLFAGLALLYVSSK